MRIELEDHELDELRNIVHEAVSDGPPSDAVGELANDVMTRMGYDSKSGTDEDAELFDKAVKHLVSLIQVGGKPI